MATHFGRVAAMAQGKIPFDAKAAADNAEIAAYLSRLPYAGFIDGTDKGETRAEPKIWTEMDKFKAAATKMQDEMAKLNVAAKSGNLDAIKAAVGETARAARPATTAIARNSSDLQRTLAGCLLASSGESLFFAGPEEKVTKEEGCLWQWTRLECGLSIFGRRQQPIGSMQRVTSATLRWCATRIANHQCRHHHLGTSFSRGASVQPLEKQTDRRFAHRLDRLCHRGQARPEGIDPE